MEEPSEKGSEPVNKFADGYRPKKKRESSRVKSEELSRKRKQFPTEACSIRCVENLPPSFISNKYIHGLKSWNTFAFLRRFPIHTGPTPPLTPQRMLDACNKNFFSEFQLCIGWGTENCKKISKRMHCFMREPRNERKI